MPANVRSHGPAFFLWAAALPVLLGALIGPTPLVAQTTATQTTPIDFDLPWAWVDFEPEGIFPSDPVREMLEIGDTLWLRTDHSVQWFDGFRWHNLGADGGLPEGRVTGLATGPEGSLLVATGGHVYVGGTGGLTPLRRTAEVETRWVIVRAFMVGEGMLLTGRSRMNDRGEVDVLHMTGSDERVVTPTPGTARSETIWNNAGTVYLDTEPGIMRWAGDGFELVEAATSPRYQASAFSSQPGSALMAVGDFLEGSWLLDLPDSGPATRIPIDGNDAVMSLTRTADGLVLAVHENGSVRLYQDGSWTRVSLPHHHRNAIHFIYADRAGDIWFSKDEGLHLFRRTLRRWTMIEYPDLDPRNRVNALLIAGDQSLWIGTHDGAVRHESNGSVAWIREVDGMRVGPVTGLTEDTKGRVWLTGGAELVGALRFEEGRATYFGEDEGFEGGRVHAAFASSDGSVWLAALGRPPAAEGAGVYRIGESGVERWMDPERSLDARAFAFAEGPDGSYWFGTTKGIVRFQDDEWATWGRQQGVGSPAGAGAISSRVFMILPTGDGGAWFSYGPDSDGGLGRLHADGTVEHFTTADGLPGNRIQEIALDPSGEMWITTEGGVARYADGNWAVFDGKTGLNPVEAWPIEFGGNSVVIGTKGGVQILNRAEETGPPPQVELLGPIAVDGGALRARWRARSYRGGMPSERVQVRTRFDDDPWSDWGTTGEIWTTSDEGALSLGRHTLEIQAKGLHGQLSEPIVQAFALPYPLFLRPVFFGPVGGLGIALILLGMSARRRRIYSAAAIQASEQRFRALVESAPYAIAIFDADRGRFVSANESAVELLGLRWADGAQPSLDDVGFGSSSDVLGARETPVRISDRVEEALQGGRPTFEWTLHRPRHADVPVEIRLARFPSQEGNLVRFSVLDVTERKSAENYRDSLEEQLRQSQKLEAVGQLTGGVAHDFNNLLTVICGNLELLLDSRGSDDEVHELATGALEAASRSSLLTARLLAFSRRQALDTQPVDLVSLTKGLLDLLRRSLGETVEIETRFERNLGQALVDPSQLEHAIINLAVNARDAMGDGGKLLIEAANASLNVEEVVKHGSSVTSFVVLSITDTGMGMTEETKARAFDPFFTTKEVGKGSGLGLSMVYGFVRQSGGFVNIHSRPGQGTTVELYLPRALKLAEEEDPEATDRAISQGSGETVLVVEDDPRVLDFTTRLCSRLGYLPLPASNAREALQVLGDKPEVAVLFSDMILPGGVNGVELALRARRVRPDLPVLLTSGYADASIVELQRSLPGVGMISKPFDAMTLATGLRNLLEE